MEATVRDVTQETRCKITFQIRGQKVGIYGPLTGGHVWPGRP